MLNLDGSSLPPARVSPLAAKRLGYLIEEKVGWEKFYQ